MKRLTRYSLAALLLGCACERNGTGNEEVVEPPVTSKPAGAPATIAPLTATSQPGYVGDAVVNRPAVIVRDANGRLTQRHRGTEMKLSLCLCASV